MRDALDAGDTEAVSSLEPLIAKGADQMLASRQDCQTKNFSLVQPLERGGSHPIERGVVGKPHTLAQPAG